MASLIQSTYGPPNTVGNFEAVVLEGNNLVHYWRNNSPAGQGKWSSTVVISSKATAPGSLIQSSYGTPYGPGSFEVVVLEGHNLVHYWRDNSATGQGNWSSSAVISSSATGAGTIIQSTYGTPNTPGNFELLVPEGKNLVHYYRDNTNDATRKWVRGPVVSNKL